TFAPESWPPWPGSRTTTANGSCGAGARVDVGGAFDFEVHCNQANDAIMSSNPTQATVFRSARAIRNRDRNIASSAIAESTRGLLHRIRPDNESPCSHRARGWLLRCRRRRAALPDVS